MPHPTWTLAQAKPKTTGPEVHNPLDLDAKLEQVMKRTWLKLRQGLHDMGLDHDRISTIFEECHSSMVELDVDLYDAVLNRTIGLGE